MNTDEVGETSVLSSGHAERNGWTGLESSNCEQGHALGYSTFSTPAGDLLQGRSPEGQGVYDTDIFRTNPFETGS